jgi:hypothetical protein
VAIATPDAAGYEPHEDKERYMAHPNEDLLRRGYEAFAEDQAAIDQFFG